MDAYQNALKSIGIPINMQWNLQGIPTEMPEDPYYIYGIPIKMPLEGLGVPIK